MEENDKEENGMRVKGEEKTKVIGHTRQSKALHAEENNMCCNALKQTCH